MLVVETGNTNAWPPWLVDKMASRGSNSAQLLIILVFGVCVQIIANEMYLVTVVSIYDALSLSLFSVASTLSPNLLYQPLASAIHHL